MCREIRFDCKTATIHANCAGRRSSYETHEVPSDALYNDLSYKGATDCSENIASVALTMMMNSLLAPATSPTLPFSKFSCVCYFTVTVV